MSHSQFQSKRFILRHAWLNLWDERITTGRINQVAILNIVQYDRVIDASHKHTVTGTVIPLLMFRYLNLFLLQNGYIIIVQLPFCSYSEGTQHGYRRLFALTIPFPYRALPRCTVLPAFPLKEVTPTLSAQVITGRYNFAWLHNGKPSSPFMTLLTESFC